MPNSRQKILNYIKEQGTTTAEELSKVFHVTPANIRHHLSILSEQGSVKVIGQKPASIRGRPTQIYTCRQENELHNLDHLSEALLRNIFDNSDPVERNRKINEVANLLCAEYKTDYANPTRRLYSAIHSLNRMHYQAHWEAHVENPRIMLGHCPYQAIITNHPELCQLDVSLLENLLEAPVRQVEKLDINAKGLPQCVFLTSRSAL